jgi:NagD protein
MDIDKIRNRIGFICDMDGVLYHGNRLLPGVKEFVAWLQRERKRFCFLTNSSERSPRELSEKMARLGIDVAQEVFYTSALATAQFLAAQCPGGSAYVIGEAGLTNALYDAGFSMNEVNPDYVIVGETKAYSFEKISRAVHCILHGARLIGTNPDLTDRFEEGIVPATKALIAPIELVTGRAAYSIGKPNPLMMRHALKKIGCNREETMVIGDRMDTDVVAGIESGIDTLLVLSGVTSRAEMDRFPYRPTYVLNSVEEIVAGIDLRSE